MKINHALSSKLRDTFNDRREARAYLPFMVAKRLAFLLPICPDINELQNFYNVNCQNSVTNIVSQLNEKIHFNIIEAMKVTYAIWNTRCQLVYNPESIDFLTMLESAKTGLIPPDTLDKLYDIKNKDEVINSKTISILENILLEGISNE